MFGCGENLLRRAGFATTHGVHTTTLFGTLGGDPEIVRDEQQCSPRVRRSGVRDGRVRAADGHVQRRRGFVGDQQSWPGGQPDRDEGPADAYHPEFVGSARRGPRRRPDPPARAVRPHGGGPPAPSRSRWRRASRAPGTRSSRRGRDWSRGPAARTRFRSPDSDESSLRRVCQVAPFERDAAARHPACARQQPDERVREGRLARTGLADDRDGLAALHREIHARSARTAPVPVPKVTSSPSNSSSGAVTGVSLASDPARRAGRRRAGRTRAR